MENYTDLSLKLAKVTPSHSLGLGPAISAGIVTAYSILNDKTINWGEPLSNIWGTSTALHGLAIGYVAAHTLISQKRLPDTETTVKCALVGAFSGAVMMGLINTAENFLYDLIAPSSDYYSEEPYVLDPELPGSSCYVSLEGPPPYIHYCGPDR